MCRKWRHNYRISTDTKGKKGGGMSEWKKTYLRDLIVIKNGKDHKKLKNGQYPVYGSGGIMRYADSYLYDQESVLLPRKGTLNNIQFVTEPFWTVDTCYYTVVNRGKVLPYFLYCCLCKMDIQSLNTGSAVPSMTFEKYYSIEVPIPPLSTQHRIATILSRYDSLIENYQKQIKLLEEAARRLYKEWFIDLRFPGHENTKIVDGLPEGWERKSVGEIGEYLNGFAFKPSDWQELGKPIIKIKEMGNGVTNDTPRNNGERVPAKYLIKAGDLLFSWSATLMVIIWSGEDGWLNQHLFKVTPAKGINREFLLQSISNTIVEFQNLTTGSTMKHIQRNKLDQVFVNVPNAEIMKRYTDISEKTRSNILSLQSQIRLLTEARDRLLPKLMSGEITV
ncbi:MAG: restriction endonuclease subunit S [Candidatus Onthomorpha sp.]|nr:restriction endonuclease subunit S [Bacteroidales bacterium]MDD7485197.1 restriction endonuclease subunit S [Bacteroidales bacterium]MDY5698797.1 restriction endonuclease subunit S [Candidatus Onthomorpha sp.]